VIRLIGLELGDSVARGIQRAPAWPTIAMQLRGVATLAQLQEDLRRAVEDRAFVGDDPLPRDREAFTQQLKRARARMPAAADAGARLLAQIAAASQAVSQAIAALPASQRMLAAEARQQRDALVYPGFMTATPWEQLNHLPRYLEALTRRLQRQAQNPERDARHAAEIARWWGRYRERVEAAQRAGAVPEELAAFRWLIEELRVSLFAQELRTPVPVSFKRIEKAWAELARHR
jgi:ATP-dependent RNA helicase HrpA